MSALLDAANLPRPIDPDAAYRTVPALITVLRESGRPDNMQRFADYLELLRTLIIDNCRWRARTLYEVGLMTQQWDENEIESFGQRFENALYHPKLRTELMTALNRELADACEWAEEARR